MWPYKQREMLSFSFLIERETYRFVRLLIQTVIPPILTTVLFILIFGYSLGDRIHHIGDYSYVVYILPGLAIMGVMTSAFSNSSTSLFVSKQDRSIENVLVSPNSALSIVVGLVIGGLIRGLVVGVLTLATSAILVSVPVVHVGWTIVMTVLIAICFSSFGIVSALWSESWDQISIFLTFVITPMVYLGGVFYSIASLPPIWQVVSHFNPIYYSVDAFRWAVLGVSDSGPFVSISVLSILTLLMLSLAVYLFKKGYKLVV